MERSVHRGAVAAARVVALGMLALGGLACASSPAPRRLLPAEHTVRPGDTLSWIAQGYGVTALELARANDISEVDRIDVGLRLEIPRGARIAHRVRAGDTLERIAGRYGVAPAIVARRNGLRQREGIEVGRRLILPRNAVLPPPPPDPRLERARRLLEGAERAYWAAEFERARARAVEAEALLREAPPEPGLRARAAFVLGSTLVGFGEHRRAAEAFARMRASDPGYEPPAEWISPRIRAVLDAPPAAPGDGD